jgi:hypothetical protein
MAAAAALLEPWITVGHQIYDDGGNHSQEEAVGSAGAS